MRLPSWFILALFPLSLAQAQTPECEALTAEQKALAQPLLSSIHPYDCCDDTILACLTKAPQCTLPRRLAADICRRVAAGKDKKEIERLMDRRAESMMALGKRAVIDLTKAPLVGDAKAPVELVEYACARCPYCKVLTPNLYKEVTEGRLKGKVRFYFKVFPIRNHEGSTEGGLAMVAAGRMGKFWPYTLRQYELFDAFCPALLADWADQAGLGKEAFTASLEDPATREMLVEAKKEGIRNKVDATPTLFINGRKYVYDMDIEVLIDVLTEEAERMASKSK